MIGASVLLAAIGAGFALWLTRGAVEAADTFFRVAAAEEGIPAAYKLASPVFRRPMPLESVVPTATRLGLTGVASTRWSSRSVSGGTDEPRGTIATRDGGTVRIGSRLVRSGLDVPEAGISGAT